MTPELKAKWIAALRSGEFSQSRNVLRHQSKNGTGYCCLGVLCVVQGMPENSDDWNTSGIPPSEYLAGLDRYYGERNTYALHLAALNDVRCLTFPEIADWIEANVVAEGGS